MKNRIRLTESDLHRIVTESVNQMLNEGNFWQNAGDRLKGAAEGFRQGKAQMDKTNNRYNDWDKSDRNFKARVENDFMDIVIPAVRALNRLEMDNQTASEWFELIKCLENLGWSICNRNFNLKSL